MSNGGPAFHVGLVLKKVQPGDDDFGCDLTPLAADHAAMDAYDTMEPGSVINLSQPPHAVAVVLPNSDAGEYTDCRHGVVLFPASSDPPLPAKRCPIILLTADHRNDVGVFLPGSGYLYVTTTSHNYELAIAATFHKAQGRTVFRVIGCLEDVDFAKMFVLVSSCKFFAHTKVLPPRPGSDFSHIASIMCTRIKCHSKQRQPLRFDPALQYLDHVHENQSERQAIFRIGGRAKRTPSACDCKETSTLG